MSSIELVEGQYSTMNYASISIFMMSKDKRAKHSDKYYLQLELGNSFSNLTKCEREMLISYSSIVEHQVLQLYNGQISVERYNRKVEEIFDKITNSMRCDE